MPKLPKEIQRTCGGCGVVTPHKVSTVKKGQPSQMAKIIRIKQKKRGTGNQGKFSKVPAKKKKQSKRPHLKLQCTVKDCGHNSNLHRPRSIKFQLR